MWFSPTGEWVGLSSGLSFVPATEFLWESMTPLGKPVVPDV